MIFWVLRFLIYSSHNSWSGSSSLTAPSVSTFVFHYSISSWVSHPQTDHPWTESVYATSWDPLITISMTVFTLPSPPVSSVWGWPKCLIAHHKLNFRIWDWWCLQNGTHSHRRLVHSGHWERCCRWSGCWRWPAWCWWWRSDVWCGGEEEQSKTGPAQDHQPVPLASSLAPAFSAQTHQHASTPTAGTRQQHHGLGTVNWPQAASTRWTAFGGIYLILITDIWQNCYPGDVILESFTGHSPDGLYWQQSWRYIYRWQEPEASTTGRTFSYSNKRDRTQPSPPTVVQRGYF